MNYSYRPLADATFFAIAPLPATIYATANIASGISQIPSHPPLSQEEQANGEIPKTCARCSKLYKRDEDLQDACSFHPGFYREGRIGSWTCCKQLTTNAAPCTKVPHVEAKQASDELRRFMTMNAQANASSPTNSRAMPEDPFPSKKRKIRAETTPQDGFVTHIVLPVDTIEGVCLRYDITVGELAKYNRGLSAASFPAFRQLLIPVGVDDEVVVENGVSSEEKTKMEQEKLRVRFQKSFRVTSQVASSYLASNDYNYEEAAKDYQEDLAFESTQTKSPKMTASRSTKFEPIPSPTASRK